MAALAIVALFCVPSAGSEVSAPAAAAAGTAQETSATAQETGVSESKAALPPTSKPLPSRRSTFLPIVTEEAKRSGLPPEIADAVCQIESAYNPNASGGAGEVGLMQILPATAQMLGYEGSTEGLAEPKTNIHFGVKYLAQAWQLANGNLCRALMKYRAGHGEERFSPLSIEYCRRAREHLAGLGAGSTIALGSVPEVSLPIKADGRAKLAPDSSRQPKSPVVTAYRRELKIARLEAAGSFGRPRTANDSARFWSAHQARIKAVVAGLNKRAVHLARRQ